MSVNHRLNVFGYTYLGRQGDPEFATSGNAGQLDLVAALRWIQGNVAVFGGDPGNVTIFGQSGGGGKVATLMAMEAAKGLFHKAAIISGAIRVNQVDDAASVTAGLFDHLGIEEGDINALQAVPTEKLLTYVKTLTEAPYGSEGLSKTLSLAPVIDDVVLSADSWVNGAPKAAKDIPLLIGSDLHETIIIVGEEDDEKFVTLPVDDDEFARWLLPFTLVENLDADELVPLVTKYRQAFPGVSNRELVVRITTDIGFWNDALRFAEAQGSQNQAPVYMYETRWLTPCFDGMWAPHGVELPFLFSRPRYGVAWDGSDSEAARDAADPDGVRFRTGDQFLRAWLGFLRDGNPSTEELVWPAYNVLDRSTMIFDGTTRVLDGVRPEVRSDVLGLTIC